MSFDFCKAIENEFKKKREELNKINVKAVVKYNFNQTLNALNELIPTDKETLETAGLTVFIGTVDIHKSIGEFSYNEYLKVKALDSNNWLRYIYLFEPNAEEDVHEYGPYKYLKKNENEKYLIDFDALYEALKPFNKYSEDLSELEYFKLLGANESARFHAERVERATIKDEGGHAGKILKYSFHSEQKALENAKNTLKQIHNLFQLFDSKLHLDYRLLLLDDFANRNLNYAFEFNGKSPRSKTTFLAEMMELTFESMGYFPQVKTDENEPKKVTGIHIYSSEKRSEEDDVKIKFEISTKDAVGEMLFDNYYHRVEKSTSSLIIHENGRLIRDQSYFKNKVRHKTKRKKKAEINDLYLLDFLFNDFDDNTSPKPENNTESNTKTVKDRMGLQKNQRHYGVSFLQQIKDNSENILYRKAPLNSYWVLPISTFSHSMLGEMRNQNIDLISNNYYLNNGADPINTPFYFVSNLLSIINRQIEKSLANLNMKPASFFKSIKKNLFRNGFTNQNGQEEEQAFWLKKFNAITATTMWLDSLKRDRSGSPFAQSIYKMMNGHLLIDVLSHYREFAYQKAFHTSENNETLIIERQKILHLLSQLK